MADGSTTAGAEEAAAGAPAGTDTDAADPAAPGRQPVLAQDSAPPGLVPLSDAEQTELKGSCAKLVTWAQQRAGKAPTRAAATQKLLEAMSGEVKLDGVDVPRCRDLLTRELRVYLAKTKELEAITTLKRLMLAMSTAVQERGKLCPSAPPVPAKLGQVKSAPYASQASDWQAEGWKCLRYQGNPRQRFQYAVKSDPAAQSFEIVARGFPHGGGEPTELFLSGKVVNGQVELHSDVYRR